MSTQNLINNEGEMELYGKYSKADSIRLHKPTPTTPINTVISQKTSNNKLSGIGLLRLESLIMFIDYLNKNKVNQSFEFDPLNMPCSKNELFKKLRYWEKKHNNVKHQKAWGIKNLDSDKKFWGSSERKKICKLISNGQQKNIDKRFFENFTI